MIQNRIISIFLLCLLIAVNWHNTISHTHEISDQKEFGVVHDHDNDHHHDQEDSGLLSWIKQFLGDFEHSDLGEKHFEQFLHPQNQLGSGQAAMVVLSPFAFLAKPTTYFGHRILQQKITPIWDLSFVDPPFLEHIPNRGPPVFS